ncbi:MAG TPA: hypothetical protein VJL28_09315 [Gemmatimonadaceae bacterium]|nr:hypothetical protein [Gemmatimonadaceae bacterium]
MTSPTLSSRLKPAQPRRLQLVMRDGLVIEGQVQIGEDQSLVLFLNSRRGGWMNLTRARRAKGDEYPGHMILQADHVVIASAPDQNVHVTGAAAAGTVERGVEIVLVGGKMLQGFLHAALQQRLSDIVAASQRFIGLSKATLLPEGRALGDIALHVTAIAFVRDLRPVTPATGEHVVPEGES